MKLSLLISLFFLVINFGSYAQLPSSDDEQRVERYLYTYYNSNKSSLRETERLMRFLEERMDLYLITLSREGMKQLKKDDAEVEAYVKQLESLKSMRVVRQTVADGRASYREILDKLVNEGISSREDVLNCRKILVLKSMEYNLLLAKQDKLLALLKDDYTRKMFIESFVSGQNETDLSSLRQMTKQVDLAIDTYDI